MKKVPGSFCGRIFCVLRSFAYAFFVVLVAAQEFAHAAPNRPTNISVRAASPSGVKVRWRDKSSNESGFTIQRQKQMNGAYSGATLFRAPRNATTFLNSPISGKFRYRVRAFNRSGRSAYTNWAAITISATPTPTPTVSAFTTGTPVPTQTPTALPTASPTPAQGINPVIFQSRNGVTGALCVAPCGVYFDASGTTSQFTNRPFMDLNYKWNFGDSSAQYLNRPGTDAAHFDGPLAAHVFQTPGDYTVHLDVSDANGRHAYASASVHVSDPEVVYQNYTYCASQTGNFTGCPAGAQHLYNPATSDQYGSAMNEFCWGDGNHPKRMLFRRGETFDTAGRGNCAGPFGNGLDGPLMLGAFGTGADPVINVSQGGSSIVVLKTNNLTITGLSFVGPYDASTGLGLPAGGISLFESSRNITIFRNSFSGNSTAIYPLGWSSGGIDSTYNIIADNYITNWQNWGVLGAIPRGALLANTIRQHPNALREGAQDSNLHTNGVNPPTGSPVRIVCGPAENQDENKRLVADNDILSTAGWSSNGAANQPCLRFYGCGSAGTAVVSGNRMQGGWGIAGVGFEGTDSPFEILWERNLFLATKDTGNAWGSTFGGQTFRNNIIVKMPDGLDTPGLSLSNFGSAIGLSPQLTSAPNAASLPNYIFNNQLVVLDSEPVNYSQPWLYDPSFVRLIGQSVQTHNYVKNNIYKSLGGGDFAYYENSATIPAIVQSDNNLLSSNGGSFLAGFDAHSISAEAQLNSLPITCSSVKILQSTTTGVTAQRSEQNLRTLLSKSGAAFENLAVHANTRISITSSSLGEDSLDCDQDGAPDGTQRLQALAQNPNSGLCSPLSVSQPYCLCQSRAILRVSGDTLTLAYNVLTQNNSPTLNIGYNYSPSTTSKIYIADNSAYSTGNTITYSGELVGRTVAGKGSDSLGQYVNITPAVSSRPAPGAYICKWQPGSTFSLDFEPKTTSPAKSAGTSVPVLNDFKSILRSDSESIDIGPFDIQ